MTLKKQFEKETGWKVDFTIDDIVEDFVMGFEYYEKYSEWLEAKLQNTSSNSDYAKCKSIGCQFYDEKMEVNCCANENLCEKCINNQHFA